MGSIWTPRTSSIIVTLASVFIDLRTGKITRPTTCIPVTRDRNAHAYAPSFIRVQRWQSVRKWEDTICINVSVSGLARGFRLQMRDAHGSGWGWTKSPRRPTTAVSSPPYFHKRQRMPRFYSVRSLWFEHARESSWDRRVIFKITACRFIARDLRASFNNIASRLGMATLFMVECLVFRSLSRTAV